MKFFKRLAAAAVAGAMILQTAAFQGITAFGASTPSTYGGWYETAYATWPDKAATSASIYYKSTDSDTYTQLNSSSDAVDTSLTVYNGSSTYSAAGYKKCVVRQTDSSTGRVDIMGIGYGDFDIQIVSSDSTTYETSVTILQEDRSGYAHFGADDDYIGAYTDEGVLKDNATVIYVTEANKNTVTWSGNTGIGEIAAHLYKDTQNGTGNSYAVRFLGEVDTTAWIASSYSNSTYYISESTGKAAGTYTDWAGKSNSYADTTNTGVAISNLNTKMTYYSGNTLDITYLSGSTAGTVSTSSTSSSTSEDTSLNMMDFKGGSEKSPYYLPRLTIEGVGTDTVAKNWGITITRGSGTEVRNINFVSSPEDACSADSSYYVWIHRCTFDVGANHCDLTDEQDKHEGDGSSDFTKDYNVTCSYNIYNNCHKTSLNGGADSTKQYNYTYHHNYYNSCSSRLPLTRYVNVHSYNNYTLGSSSGTTAISARASAFVFSEANYYDSVTTVFGSASSTDYGSGFIKSYGDTFVSTTPSWSSYIVQASSRTATIDVSSIDSANQHLSTDTYINNFDVDSTNFYYSDGASNVSYLTSAANAKTYVTSQSGVMKDAEYDDIMNISSDDDDDTTDGTITSEQTLDASNLSSTSYFQINDASYVYVNNSAIRITYQGKISFTTGIDGAVVTIVGKHASETVGAVDRTLTLYDSTGTAVTDGEITYIQGAAATTVTIPTSDSLSSGSYYLTASNHLDITSITVSFPGVITGTETLTFSNGTGSEITITANNSDYSDYFTLLATDSVNASSGNYNQNFLVSTEGSDKTFANYYTYNCCLKSVGATKYTDNIPTARAIKFTTSGSGLIQLYGVATGTNNDGSDRVAYVYDSEGNANASLGTLKTNGTSNNVVSELIKLPSAGTYYITFDSGISLYAVNVTVGVSLVTDNGYIITDSTDSYIAAGATI
ncbi:MAG: hypothetical protein LIO44_04565 [Eubacterium sp.]|nr:hypothetical protein [Eubacterium sp.]